MNLFHWMSRRARAALLLAGCGALAPALSAQPTLVVLGDSLSAGYGIRVEQGWVALLARRLAQQGYGYQLVNASVSGETTEGGLARLPRVLATHHPQLLIVELGANDGLRGLPVEGMRRNLGAIVRAGRATGARVLLIGTRIPTNYGPQYTEAYYASFGQLAAREHLPLVPFLLEGIALDERNFQPDRLHPTAAVQGVLLNTVWVVLKPLLAPPARAAEKAH